MDEGCHRGDDVLAGGERQELTTLLRYSKVAAQQRLSRGRAQADDDSRLHQFNLNVEPRTARRNLERIRLLVNPALAAGLPLKVFDGVCHIGVAAIDAGFMQRLVEQSARRTDEGTSLQVFFVVRLLADEHDACLGLAFTEDGLCTTLPKITRAAILGCIAGSL